MNTTLRLGLAAALTVTSMGCEALRIAPAGQLAGDAERELDREAHPHGAQVRFAQRLSADGTMPANALWKMKQQRDQMLAVHSANSGNLLHNWGWLGPGNIGGRVRALCIHPTTPSTMWAGSVGGGIFKTTNSGASWQPLDDFAPVMSVGCMVLDPNNPNRIFAGTGEGFFDTLAGSSILAASRGAGIFVSDDGGTTWNQMPATAGTEFQFVNRIAISPASNQIMLVATMDGIFRSADGGTTFTKQQTAFAMDVVFHPSDGDLAIAGVRDGQPMYSTDGGVSWNVASGTGWQQRSELAYAKGNPNVVYAACSLNDYIRVYRSNDGGRTFTLRTSGQGVRTYSRYNNTLWVDPANANHVLVGGVRLHKSTNGGVSFVNAYSGSYYDFHVIVEHPDYNGTTNQTVFHGNDAGIYRTNAVAAATIRWTELNNNLGMTQFYGAAMATNGRVIGGTQDNGSLLFTGNPEGWTRELGGDGCYCATDPTNANIMYAQIYRIRLYRSTNGGTSWSSIATRTKIPDRGSNFIPYITLDPNEPNRLYFAGASVWVSNNIKGAATFREVKPELPCAGLAPRHGNSHFGLDPRCNVSVIQVARGNPNLVWAGHNHGDLYVSNNALATTPTWRRVDQVNLHPDRWVGSIAISPTNPQKVYVSFLGYHRNNVWVTTDGGTTWAPRNGSGSGALPETPVNWVTTHPTVDGCLFAGTDIGLFFSTDDGNTWETTTEGSGTSPIAELQWKDNRTMMVVTHGRGIFTVDVGEPPFVRQIGAGCSSGTIPSLQATVPTPGVAQTYAVSSATAGAPCILLLDATTRPTNIGGGCMLYVNGSVMLPIGNIDSSGRLQFTLPIPVSKDVIGAEATAQAAVFTPGPALGIAELTNAVEMRAGY